MFGGSRLQRHVCPRDQISAYSMSKRFAATNTNVVWVHEMVNAMRGIVAWSIWSIVFLHKTCPSHRILELDGHHTGSGHCIGSFHVHTVQNFRQHQCNLSSQLPTPSFPREKEATNLRAEMWLVRVVLCGCAECCI